MSVKKKSRGNSLRKINTSDKEEELRELLIDIINEEGLVSKYILEGHLLYTIGCSNVETYNVIMSLTNNGELLPVELSDGEYYRYFPL